MKNEVTTIEMTRPQLIEEMMKIEKSTFVNVVTVTVPAMNKKNNPYFGLITKKTKRNYLMGNDYETRVQNNEKKEGLEGFFQTQQSNVGVHVSKCVLFNEKLNTHYLQLEPFEEIKPTDVEFYFEGNPIDKRLFQDFLKTSKPSEKQVQEKKVLIQCPKFDSIVEISFDKRKITVVE